MKDEMRHKVNSDISVIKDILIKSENTFIVEPWAFYIWGGLLVIGSIVHFIMGHYYLYSLNYISMVVWLPFLIFAMTMEMLSWVKKSLKEHISLKSKNNINLLVSGTLISVVAVFIVFLFIKNGNLNDLPVLLLLLFAVMILLYSNFVFSLLKYPALCMVLAAVILYFLDLSVNMGFLAAGSFAGLSCLISGYLMYRKEIN